MLQALTCLPVLSITLPAAAKDTGPKTPSTGERFLSGMQYLLDNHQNMVDYMERFATLEPTARQVVDKVQRTTIALAQQLKQQGLVEHTKPWNNCSEGAVLRWADRFGDMGLNSHLPYCRLNQPRLVPAMRAYEAARWELKKYCWERSAKTLRSPCRPDYLG